MSWWEITLTVIIGLLILIMMITGLVGLCTNWGRDGRVPPSDLESEEGEKFLRDH